MSVLLCAIRVKKQVDIVQQIENTKAATRRSYDDPRVLAIFVSGIERSKRKLAPAHESNWFTSRDSRMNKSIACSQALQFTDEIFTDGK